MKIQGILTEKEYDYIKNIEIKNLRVYARGIDWTLSPIGNKQLPGFFKYFISPKSTFRFYELKEDGKEKSLLQFDRLKRGKFTCKGKEYKVDEFMSLLEPFFKLIMDEKDLENYYQFMRELTGEKLVKKNETVIKVGTIDELRQFKKENIVSTEEDFCYGVRYNGKQKIYNIKCFIKYRRPKILVHGEDCGVVEMVSYSVETSNSNKVAYERITKDKANILNYHTSLEKFFNKQSPNFAVYFWGKGFKFIMNFFTIERLRNGNLLFSYTESKDKKNTQVTIFAEMSETEFIEFKPFAYDTMAAFFGFSKKDFIRYFQHKISEMKGIKEEGILKNEELNNWLDENNINLRAANNIDSASAEKLLMKIKEGLDFVAEQIKVEHFRKINTISIVQNEFSYQALYHHETSELSFDTSSLYSDSTDTTYSNVFHEYGHLIHFSLMNENIVGKNSATNTLKISTFLKSYKNCSYIDKVMGSKLSYYQKDTELFARLFETLMCIQTNMYNEKEAKRNRLNTIRETRDFVDFLNNEFDLNIRLKL